MTYTLRLLAKIALIPMCVAISSAAYPQTDIMNSLREKLAAGFKKLETACGEDVRKYCSTVTPGEGRLMLCIEAHEDKISDGCSSALDEVAYRAEAIADNLREAMNACRGDLDKFCATTQPGQGRLAACLATNKISISKNCAEAVQKVQDQ
jgi:hypothetical protein